MFTTSRDRQGGYVTLRERRRFARTIDALLADATRPTGRTPGLRPLYDPRVVRACAPALRRVRDALLDACVDVRPQTLDLVERFVCDGASSPLYGRDAEAAARGARQLRTAFTVALPPLAGRVRRVA